MTLPQLHDKRSLHFEKNGGALGDKEENHMHAHIKDIHVAPIDNVRNLVPFYEENFRHPELDRRWWRRITSATTC